MTEATTTTPLCSIMHKYGSDKGLGLHNYTKEYYKIFNSRRFDVKSVFELGIGTTNRFIPTNMGPKGVPGASLRGWREFFPNAIIYGADIDKSVLIREERIESYYVDQTSELSVMSLWESSALKDLKFDLMVDDSLHKADPNFNFLINSYHKLNVGGVYIIEDVHVKEDNINEYRNRLESLLKKVNFKYEILKIEHPTNKIDNCIVKLSDFNVIK
jgi:hypothetical protein